MLYANLQTIWLKGERCFWWSNVRINIWILPRFELWTGEISIKSWEKFLTKCDSRPKVLPYPSYILSFQCLSHEGDFYSNQSVSQSVVTARWQVEWISSCSTEFLCSTICRLAYISAKQKTVNMCTSQWEIRVKFSLALPVCSFSRQPSSGILKVLT